MICIYCKKPIPKGNEILLTNFGFTYATGQTKSNAYACSTFCEYAAKRGSGWVGG